MGLRPLLGPPCIPPEAPPWDFPTSDIPRGLRGFRCGSFLAALGDLPARRAMPVCAFALDERPEVSGWLYGVSEMTVIVGERFVMVGVRVTAASRESKTGLGL